MEFKNLSTEELTRMAHDFAICMIRQADVKSTVSNFNIYRSSYRYFSFNITRDKPIEIAELNELLRTIKESGIALDDI